MGWALVFAGASAASGVFGAFESSRSNRRIRADLAEIKRYLIELRGSIAEVRRLNVEILERLDALPEQVRAIVREEVAEALLAERYSVVADIRDNYLALTGGHSFSIRSQEWLIFSGAMRYLFDHEGRLSRVPDLIEVCEIALVITKYRALGIVRPRVDEKTAAIAELRDAHRVVLQSRLDKLLIDLNNASYIVSHNLDEDLQSIDDLQFSERPDRLIEERYDARECHEVTSGGGLYGSDRTRTVCRTVARTRQVPDVKFHRARDAHVADLRVQVSAVAEGLRLYSALTAALELFVAYQGELDNGPATKGLMYFSDEIGAPKSFSAAETVESIEYDNDDFHDYIDGCHGDCDSVKHLLVEAGNKVFINDRC